MRPSTRSPHCHTSATSSWFAWFSAWAGSVLLVARHPSLWWAAVRQLVRIARPNWWRRPPFLPLPDRAYVHYRLDTAYGPGVPPRPEDLLAYLRWCAERER